MKYLTTIILLTFLNATAMAKEIKTEILINATPEKVLSILTIFDNYPNWNPFIKSIKYTLANALYFQQYRFLFNVIINFFLSKEYLISFLSIPGIFLSNRN
jgi:hypothetical protein